MGKSVIADLVTFVDHAPQQLGMRLPVFAQHEKGSRHVFAFENIQDRRRPLRIRSVIKGKRD